MEPLYFYYSFRTNKPSPVKSTVHPSDRFTDVPLREGTVVTLKSGELGLGLAELETLYPVTQLVPEYATVAEEVPPVGGGVIRQEDMRLIIKDAREHVSMFTKSIYLNEETAQTVELLLEDAVQIALEKYNDKR